MALLAKILLRDLELDSRACMKQVCEERRGGLADLAIDRAVFNLNYDVIIEFAIEFFEELDCGGVL